MAFGTGGGGGLTLRHWRVLWREAGGWHRHWRGRWRHGNGWRALRPGMRWLVASWRGGLGGKGRQAGTQDVLQHWHEVRPAVQERLQRGSTDSVQFLGRRLALMYEALQNLSFLQVLPASGVCMQAAPWYLGRGRGRFGGRRGSDRWSWCAGLPQYGLQRAWRLLGGGWCSHSRGL